MKQFYTNIKKTTGVAALGVLMTAGLVSCDTSGLTDTLDEFGVVVELEPINTSSTVLLYDAVSGELIDQNVTITYSGDNGDDVIDTYSDPISSSEVSDGILGFGINNSVTPSETSPASIRLVVEADGYISRARTISLTSTGKNDFEVELVRENNKPQGVKTATSTEGQADATTGAVQQDFTVASDAEGDAESGTSIEVESGTTFKGANGNNLTGQLTSSVTYFNPNEQSAMKSIPVDLTVDEDGELISVLGGSSVSITDGQGNVAATAEVSAKAKGVSNHGVTYVFKIPSGMTNIITQQPFKAGDYVYLILVDQSYNVSDQIHSVVDLGNNTFGAKYTSSNIPRFTAVYQRIPAEQKCVSGINVTRNGNSGNLTLDVFRTGFNLPLSVKAGKNSTANSNWYFPRNTVDVTVSSGVGTTTASGVNICENNTISLPEPPAGVIDAQINVALVCANGGKISTTDLPGASVLYKKVGSAAGTKWGTGTNVNFHTNTKGTALEGGTLNVSNVVQGEDYDFKVNFDGESYNQVINITGTTTSDSYTINNNDICTN